MTVPPPEPDEALTCLTWLASSAGELHQYVTQLHAEGLTTTQLAAILGVSRQRASALLREAESQGPARARH